MKKDKVAGSDDEAEAEAQFLSVSNYHLEDENRVPVSFDVLPIQWGNEAEKNSDATKEQVFLHGFADNGLKMIMMEVTAWRFDLSKLKPEVLLLSSKDERWIRLQKPRNSYQDTVRTILITVHFLHRVKKNPKIAAKSVWDYIFQDKELSFCKSKPSRKDLLDHMPLICEAAKRDAVLAKSQLLLTVLKEKLGNKELSDEEVKGLIQPAFLVDDIENGINEASEESKAEDDLSHAVCAICDDGGNLTCCEGPCMRSFHATKVHGRNSKCVSLGFTQKESIQSFYCKNCQYNQHQCFACGKLGSSDKVKGAEVIKCASATCDHFYHPHCVAKLLPQVVKHVAEELERNIADANSFTCPVHYCCVCKEVENVMEPELQFAVCRRCPKSYHRKCLPREITFEDTDKDIIPRAWEGLLPKNRILIYCLNHEIDEKIGTPIRDHIKFPIVNDTVREINATNEKMKFATEERVISKKKNVDVDNSSGESTANGSKVTGKLSSGKVGSRSNSENMSSGSNSAKQPRANGKSGCLSENTDGSKVSGKLSSGKVGSKTNSEKMVSGSNIAKQPKANGKSGCLIENANGSKVTGKLSSGKAGSKTNSEKKISGSNITKQPKANGKSGGCLTENKASISKKFKMPDSEENQPLRHLMSKGSKQTKPNNQVNNAVRKIDQRNGKPPLLSLLKHKAIAQEQRGHLSSQHEVLEMESCNTENEDDGNDTDNLMLSHDPSKSTDDQGDQASMNGDQKRSSHCGKVDEESQEGQERKKSESGETSKKRKHTDENDRSEQSVVSSAKKQSVRDDADANIEEQHSEEEEKCLTESGTRQRVGHMGYGYAQPISASESSYKMTTPAIGRCAPRLDELNHVRTGSLGSEPPAVSRSGNESRVSQYGCVDRLLGFAPGPNLAYSSRHSAGWINE